MKKVFDFIRFKLFPSLLFRFGLSFFFLLILSVLVAKVNLECPGWLNVPDESIAYCALFGAVFFEYFLFNITLFVSLIRRLFCKKQSPTPEVEE